RNSAAVGRTFYKRNSGYCRVYPRRLLKIEYMPTELKKKTVDALTKEAKECTGLVITAFKGLKTTEINEFRAKLKPLKGSYKIVKNSLTRIALKNAGMDALAEALKGPSAIVIEKGDPVATIKAVFDFAKAH